MKNVLNNEKTVQMLMFALQKKIWKKERTICNQLPIRLSFQLKQTHSHVFVRSTSFLGFCCTNMFFFVFNLGLFEITEWEPIKRGAIWFNSLSHSKTKNAKVVSLLNLFSLLNAVTKKLYNFDAW